MESQKQFQSACKMAREDFEMNWRIAGFNLMPFVRDHPLFGPIIRLGKGVQSPWQLLMSKQRGDNDKLPSLGFKLVKLEDNNVWDVCRYDVTLKDLAGKQSLKVVENALAGGEEDLPYRFVKAVSEETYLNEDGKEQADDDSPIKESGKRVYSQEQVTVSHMLNSLFKEPEVMVVCNVRYTYVDEQTDDTSSTTEERSLIQDLKQLYTSQKFADVILVSRGKEFPVHRSILCSRTFGFDVLLQEDKNQVLKGPRVSIDMPESTVSLMMLYLYTGELSTKLSAADYYELLKASKKFGINRLKVLCSKLIEQVAREDPSCDTCGVEDDVYARVIGDVVTSDEDAGNDSDVESPCVPKVDAPKVADSKVDPVEA